MKALLTLLILSFAATAFSSDDPAISYSKGEICVRGKRYSKQVFVEQDGVTKQITNFQRWEIIDEIALSRDEKLLVIHHRKHGDRAFTLSVLDMDSHTITASCIPGYGGELYWTKDDNVLLVSGCGAPCREFWLFDRNLNKVAQANTASGEVFLDYSIVVTFEPVCFGDGIFEIRSLKDLSVLASKSFQNKYGHYYPGEITAANGKVTVVLDISACAQNDSIKRDSTVTETIEY